MENQMTEDVARETLGIKDGEWIITVNDEEFIVLKAAVLSHAELAATLAKKIEVI